MTQPDAFSQQSPEILKLKEYLMAVVTREMEAHPPPPREQRQVLLQHLEHAYQQTKLQLSDKLREQIFREITNDLIGFGPLQALLDDSDISEVMVNGPHQIYVERKGKLTLTDIVFENDQQVLRIIDRIILPLGRRIDADSPTVDARLPDGSRVNAVIPPVAVDGPSITIRKFTKERLSIQQLIDFGSLTKFMAEFLRACVVSHLNIVIAGGTGSGKTTLLNVLSSFIPSDERIVTIEDAAELQLQQSHIVRMETKPPNTQGNHAVTIRDLVRNSLRMRPDRIVVGEVRGGEALDMLQAMNTGHDGSLTTLHANSPRDSVSRLETMCMMAGMDLPVQVIREQIASAIDVVVQQSRLRDGSRKVTAIAEISGMEGDRVVMTDIFHFEQTGVTPEGQILGELKPTGIRPLFSQRLEAAGFHLGPEIFGANLSQMLGNRKR